MKVDARVIASRIWDGGGACALAGAVSTPARTVSAIQARLLRPGLNIGDLSEMTPLLAARVGHDARLAVEDHRLPFGEFKRGPRGHAGAFGPARSRERHHGVAHGLRQPPGI